MKKRITRLLSIILMIMMIISVIPAQSLAAAGQDVQVKAEEYLKTEREESKVFENGVKRTNTDIYIDDDVRTPTDASDYYFSAAVETDVEVYTGKDNTISVTPGYLMLYRFNPEVSQNYTISTSSGYDTYGYLCDGKYTVIDMNDDSGYENNFKINADLEAGKTYFIGVRLYGWGGANSVNLYICNHSDEEQIEFVEGIESTCDFRGYTDGYYCLICNSYVSGHELLDYSDVHPESSIVYSPLRPATCVECGYTEGYYCDLCGATISGIEEIAPKGHSDDWEVVPKQEVTCTQDGYTKGIKCPDCGEFIMGHEFLGSATGHKGEWITDIEPTCSSVGKKHRICEVCGENETDKIACLPHTDENKDRVCDICENTIKERYSVLVLDISGSMCGDPIQEMKEASLAFIQQVYANDSGENYIAVVAFETDSKVICGFTNNTDELKNAIDSLYDEDMTNLAAGLEDAKTLLENVDDSAIKNILVMCDGYPNEGEPDGETAAYNVIATMPAEWNVYGLYFAQEGYDSSAADVMKKVGRNGYYEVTDGSELTYVFVNDWTEKIEEDVNKVVITIACPVEVSVTLNGETLDRNNPQTLFGTLEFEGEGNDETKILTLTYRNDYIINVEATDEGTMDYSIAYFCNDKELYSMLYPTVNLTDSTKVQGEVDYYDRGIALKIDYDGDGSVDATLTGTDYNCNHVDNDHNGVCDICGGDSTVGCTCHCHRNDFLWKLQRFFWRIFARRRHQICNCGVAHW